MMRLLEGLLFLGIASGVHLGIWSLSPDATGSNAAGGGGLATMTTTAATATQTALVARWDSAPDASVAGPALAVAMAQPTGLIAPSVPEKLREVPLKPEAPAVLARPEQAPAAPQTQPDPPPPEPVARAPDQRPKARPDKIETAQNTPPETARSAAGQADEKIRGIGGTARTQSQDAAKTNALRAAWGASIYAKVERNLTAPRGSKAEGTAKLALRVAANGNLQGLKLTRSSGDDLLDRAALQAIKRAGRFSKAPKGLVGDSHDFSLSLTFTR